MVGLGAGRHVKFRRLTIPERYAFFMGVLSLAAQSPVRGCLMIGSLAVEPADVAAEADVPEKVAASAMEKLRAVEVIVRDEHGLEWVHDFQDWNPEPKNDGTNAERQQRYRERQRASRNGGSVTASNAEVTPAEVKREVEEEKNKAATPLRGARPGTVSRSLAETVACPRCGVAPGEKCDGVRAKRESCHLERHHAVGELLDLPKVSPSSARSAKRPDASRPAYSPDPEAVALRDAHFPDEAVQAVESCAITLRFRRQDVTPEAVRALLYGESGEGLRSTGEAA